VALPHIAGGLSAGEDEATWVLTSDLVANAIGPARERLAGDRGRPQGLPHGLRGARQPRLAPVRNDSEPLGLLVAARTLEGLGGGGLAPSEQAVLTDAFSGRRRGQAFAIYGVAAVVAPAIGPTLGGFISDQYSWRWIFLINVPIGLLSLLLISPLVSDPRRATTASQPALQRRPGPARQSRWQNPRRHSGPILAVAGFGIRDVLYTRAQGHPSGIGPGR
jgi:DHA2 family multidrug resistance protein